jgi:hypothetical protein
MTMENMNVRVECWVCAADSEAIWLLSDGDAWRSPPVPASSDPHFEVELLLAGHETERPVLIHSTSWRPDGPTIMLTYVAVLACEGLVLDKWPAAQPVSADLLPAVGKPYTHGAAEVPVPRYIDVLHHALRHLTYLVGTDATARAALVGHWTSHLAQLEPAVSGMYESTEG